MEPEAVEYAYRPGDVIQDCIEPFAKVLNDGEKGQRCDHCFKSSMTLKRCAGCSLMHYCEKSCQAKDWKFAHKFECKSDCFKLEFFTQVEQKLMIVSESTVLRRPPLLFRLFAILKLHPELGDKPYKLYSGATLSFNDLQCDPHHAKPSFDPIVKYCAEMASQLEKEESHRQGHGHAESDKAGTILSHLLKLAGIWQSRAFVIKNEDQSRNIGSGLYIEPSIFNHSCRPDAVMLLQGARMQIRAVSPIPKGVDPHVSHLSGDFIGHQERGALLQERYQFQCKCPRCTKEGEDGDEVDYEAFNRLILKASVQEDWTSYYKSHQGILKYLRKLYHEYDEGIANQLFLTFKVAQELGAPRAELTSLAKETEDHLKVTFGEGHPDWGLFMRLKRDLGLSY